MKKEVLIKSTIAMLLSVTATTFANASNSTTGKSRQEVISEMIVYKKAGLLDIPESGCPQNIEEIMITKVYKNTQ